MGENVIDLATSDNASFLYISIQNSAQTPIQCDLDIRRRVSSTEKTQDATKYEKTKDAMEYEKTQDAMEYTDSSKESHTGETFCQNCRKWVSTARFSLHSAFCERQNTVCKVCDQVLLKAEFDDHWHCQLCPDGKVP